MIISDIQAIDVHAHYGVYCRSGGKDLLGEWLSADAESVAAAAREANTQWTIVSPYQGLFPRGQSIAEVELANHDAAATVPTVPGLLQWVIIDPRRPATYDQARDMLRLSTCPGIKIHGEEHQYFVTDHGDEIFAFAAERRTVVLAHTGNYHTNPLEFVPFSDRYPEMQLILAHLGNSDDCDLTRHVRAIQAGCHGNLYVDTSSMKSMFPGLVEWAVAEVGAEKILYGTDSPTYFSCSQRARIDHAGITDDQKLCILRTNAEQLLTLP